MTASISYFVDAAESAIDAGAATLKLTQDESNALFRLIYPYLLYPRPEHVQGDHFCGLPIEVTQ